MFDPEQAIAGWRRQMLAAGISSPVPLEELENHLREEIERQLQGGATAPHAFENAPAQLGQGAPLNNEFEKAGGFPGRLGKQTSLNRVLALSWLALCAWNFFGLAARLAATPNLLKFRISLNLNWFLFLAIFLWGIIASIRIFAGINKEIRTLRAIAVFGAVAFGISTFTDSIFLAVFAVFCGVSLWLLRSPVANKTTS
jgi:hypothetical protein